MQLTDLILPNECKTAYPSDDISITSIVHQTDQVIPGCLFVCLKGSKHDTHQDLNTITKKGACVILVEEMPKEIPQNAPLIIEVPSCRRALAYAWSRACGSPTDHLHMVGITGTNGKTSTATMLEWALRAQEYHTALIGTVCCHINGIPYSPLEEEQKHRLTTMTTPDPDILYPLLQEAVGRGVTHVVMEVSSHALALEKVAPIRFEEAVFTNLSSEHMDFHGNMEDYMSAKRKLFLQTNHATVNVDDPFGARIANCLPCAVTTCGSVWEANAMASQIEIKNDGIRYFYHYDDIKNIVSMPITGTFTVYNSILALTSAIYLGVKPYKAVTALKSLSCIPGRMQRVNSKKSDIEVYIDYAHTEQALRNLLLAARKFSSGKLTLVFGCGGDRDSTKRGPMGRCAADLADFTYITSDNSRTEQPEHIISQILEGHHKPECRQVILDRKKAIETAILDAAPNDTILLVGKGHETYEIRGTTLFPFDEHQIALSAIEKRGKK